MRRGIAARVGAALAKADGGNGRAARLRGSAARRDSHTAEEVRELFRGEVEAAKQRLVELLQSDEQRVALAAANAILDRVFGKPRPVAEPPEEKRALPPIEFYEVDCVVRPDADEPGVGGDD